MKCLNEGLQQLLVLGYLALAAASLTLAATSDQGDLKYVGPPKLSVQQSDWQSNAAIQESNEQAASNGNEKTGLISSMMKPLKATLGMVRHIFGSAGRQKLRQMTFDSFARLYNRTYSAAERPLRLAAYLRHMAAIEQNALEYESGQVAFKMEPNEFVDWTDDELKRLASARVPPESELLLEDFEDLDDNQSSVDHNDADFQANATNSKQLQSSNQGFRLQAGESALPAAIDWRTSGCVAAPIDQGVCGSCYAVATIQVVEATKCIREKTGGTLSPQHIVDCATKANGYNNHGCNGGWPTAVFRFLQDNSRAIRNSCYDYTGKKGTCLDSQKRKVVKCPVLASSLNRPRLTYKVLHSDNEIMAALAKYGPVTTVLKTTDKLLYYSRGIMQDNSCSRKRDDVDHALQIVGYGQERGINYWLIKNSWGTSWGEGGYAKVRRGYTCSVGRRAWALTG